MSVVLPKRVEARIAALGHRAVMSAQIASGRVVMAAPLITAGKNAAKAEAPNDDPLGRIVFSGYATVFDVDSEIYFGFYRMRIKRGAFKEAFDGPDLDARFMVNHDGLAFARTTNGTLTLEERRRGVYHTALAADVPEMRTLAELVRRKDMDQMSFAAWISEDEWETCDCDPGELCECIWTRHIHKFNKVDEVSVVTFPAIAASDVTVTRASENSGEVRSAPASDADQRDPAPEDASTSVDASDPLSALTEQWLWAHDTEVTFNGSHRDSERRAP